MAVTKAVTAITTEMWGKEELVSTLGSQQQTRNNSLYRLQMANVIKDFYDSFDDTNYVLIVLYIVIIALALISNILVIIVVFKYQYMRSVTNYFVVNLSVADLLVTIICMPMSISQAVTIIWVYGELMCKLFYYLQGVAVAASVFTFTTMSIDRYLAIRSPIGFRQRFNRKVTIIIIGVLWAVSLSIFIPVLKLVILRNVSAELWNITLTSPDVNGEILEVLKPPNYYVCLEDFESLGVDSYIFGVGYFTCVYAIPGFIVILAYSMMGRTLCARKPPFDSDSTAGSASSQQGFRLVRERRRVAWILLLLAGLFALCWLPYNVVRLLIDFQIVDRKDSIFNLLSYCLFLGHANSAINPTVYCFMTRNFRKSIKEILFHNILHSHRADGSTRHRKTQGSTVLYRAPQLTIKRDVQYNPQTYTGGSDSYANLSFKTLSRQRATALHHGIIVHATQAAHATTSSEQQRSLQTTILSSGHDCSQQGMH